MALSLFVALALAQSTSTQQSDQVLAPLALRSGNTLEIAGAGWKERATMWEDCALLSWTYCGTGADDSLQLASLDGGSSKLRTVYEVRHQDMTHVGLDWSADGEYLGGLLDLSHGVVAVEAATGSARSLLTLPKRIAGDELREVSNPFAALDPSPGVATDGRFLMLLQEGGLRNVDRWLGRPLPTVGHWLVAVSPEVRGLAFESGSAPLPGRAKAWSVAKRRHSLFVLLDNGRLREVSLRGEPRIRAEVELPGVRSIAVSPDEKWLMLECEDRASAAESPAPADSQALGRLQEAISSIEHGFVLYDLEHGAIVKESGSEGPASWSPDSERIAFVASGSLHLYDLAARLARPLAKGSGESVRESDRVVIRPLWSRDSRRIAVSLGHYNRKIGPRIDFAIDLDRREVLELPGFDDSSTWAPLPTPFPEGIRFVRAFPPVRWE